MSDSLKHTIFNETECISEQTLFDYIDKKLSAKENHLVERHMLHCELCSDALEGLQLVKNREHIHVINQKINERIATLNKGTKIVGLNYKTILSVAATVLLLVGGIFFFNLFNQKKEMAIFNHEQTASEPPPPPPMPGTEVNPQTEPDALVRQEGSTKADNSLLITQESPAPLKEFYGADQEKQYATSISADDASVDNNGISRGMDVPGAASESKNAPAQSKSVYNDGFAAGSQQAVKEAKQEELQKTEAIVAIPEKDKADAVMSPPVSQSESTYAGRASERDVADEVSAKASKKKAQSNKSAVDEKRKRAESEDQVIAYAPQNVAPGEEVAESTQTVALSGTIEQNPIYPGGQDSLISFIQKNINQSVLQNNYQFLNQAVYVEFTINTDGYLKNPKITKGINTEIDKEVIRILNISPKWTPGRDTKGKASSKKVSIPVRLK